MKDIGIDEDFDVVIDHRNDLALVDGNREFEQHIRTYVTGFFYDEIGSVDSDNVETRIRLHANRVARRSNRVDGVQSIEVRKSETVPNTLEVNIVYQTGDTFAFELN